MIYEYKDAHREYWRLEVEDLGQCKDHRWGFKLSHSSCGSRWYAVFRGTLEGQGDTQPTLEEFMKEITYRFSCLAIGFSTHGMVVP